MPIKQYIKRSLRFIVKGVPVNHVTAEIVTLPRNELLQGRVALITGGTSGIGFHIAKAFLASGATVIITGRDKERTALRCNELANIPGNKGRVHSLVLDNTCVECFTPSIEKISSRLNVEIDLLVNNAGVLGGNISNATEKEYDLIMDTNMKGTFFMSQAMGRYMKHRHIKGNILNIASSSSFRPASSAYTVSKWGIRGLTLGLAKSLAPYGITVNGIAPGPTATPMLTKGEGDNIHFERNPAGRFAMPEEIANMAVILTSGMGRTIVGDIVCMTGGAGLITFDDVNYNF